MMRPLADILDDVLADLGMSAKPAAGTAGARNIKLAWVNPMSLRETPSREGQPGVSLKFTVVK